MAAYAATISLKQTIQRLLKSSNILFLPSQDILQIAYAEVGSLQECLGRLGSSDTERVNALNAQIRDVVCKLEDAIISHASNELQTKNQINIGAGEILSIDLWEVKQELCSLTEIAKMMQEENRIEDLLAEEDDNIPLRTDLGKCSKMVGFSDPFNKVKDILTNWQASCLGFVSLIGMAGIGKTTLARKIFEDPQIVRLFKQRAFVSVGPKYKLKEVMLGVLAQLTPHIDEIQKKEDDDVGKCLYENLGYWGYLIVLDNVWDTSIYDLCKYLPLGINSNRVLFTTSIQRVAKDAPGVSKLAYQMPFLNEEESWNLLHERVFGEEYLCPLQLEKHGKKIAENCEGLPLAIVMIADILSKNDKTPEYWKETAEKKNSVFTDAYDQMFEVLYLSYKYLSQYLKPCFLYMGIFPPGWKITTSKIVKLLSAEGFLEPPYLEKLEHFARNCFQELMSTSLAKVHQQSSKIEIESSCLGVVFSIETKIWSLHSAFWHLCNKLARREKFFHVIDSYPNSISTEVIKSQQRFCIHNNVLFAIKEVYDSIESISMVRSLLCTGIHHQYPVRICFGLRFLRVLDALTVRFYKFPIEVLKLVQLRYLALTCNGNVPTSISKLWNLEYFFVRRHLSIKPFGSWPFLPVEIWNMKKLRHLQSQEATYPIIAVLCYQIS